jgi:hypothetical protein
MSLILAISDLVGAGVSVQAEGAGVFPRSLSSYGDESMSSILEIIQHRISVEPLNLVATGIFLIAIIHTFCAPLLLRLAKRLEERHHLQWLASEESLREEAEEPVSFLAVFMHYLGEIEAVFGFWAIPLLGIFALSKGWEPAKYFLENSVHFNEAVFVVVVMAIASTQPILYLGERLLSAVSRLTGGSPASWWFGILTFGPVLGSFITEPAAMTICALLLGQHFFRYRPSKRLAYATVALLFSNISLGGVLTNFAAPPVLMVAGTWGWDLSFMVTHFGLRAVGAVFLTTSIYYFLLRRELATMELKVSEFDAEHPVHERAVPPAVIAGNLLFLAWTVTHAQSSRLVIIGFLFFLAFVDATRHFQRAVSLRAPLLVGFFLAGLIIHGAFQTWWLEPMLQRIEGAPLFFTSLGLSALNDNAAITYLASLVPDTSPDMRYFVTAGALCGGGLTIIANAPNPVGNSLLARFFDGGVSQAQLLLAALVPVLVNILFFLVLS